MEVVHTRKIIANDCWNIAWHGRPLLCSVALTGGKTLERRTTWVTWVSGVHYHLQ